MQSRKRAAALALGAVIMGLAGTAVAVDPGVGVGKPGPGVTRGVGAPGVGVGDPGINQPAARVTWAWAHLGWAWRPESGVGAPGVGVRGPGPEPARRGRQRGRGVAPALPAGAASMTATPSNTGGHSNPMNLTVKPGPRAAARIAGLLLVAAAPWAAVGQTADKLDRSVLPIAEPSAPSTPKSTRARSRCRRASRSRRPTGAPNVVIVLIDDMGFGVPSSFGGPVAMPTLDKLAQDGLRYNNFHTTALCSPTRAALKSGRNHHTVNMGFITEMATGFPGATGQIPSATAPLAEMLRLNGYATAAFGKWHETAAWEASVVGPFDRWPTRQGFDKFYGFLGGETNQWAPLPLRRHRAWSSCRTTRTTTS